MTLIAGYPALHNLPTVTGDMLKTWPTAGTPQLAPIPSQRSPLSEFVGISWELCQKAVIIDDYMGIAWAGSQVGAAKVIHAIRERTGNKPLEQAALNEFLASLDGHADLAARELSIIGLSIDQDRSVSLFRRNARDLHNTILGPIAHYEGEGGGDFVATVQSLQPALLERAPGLPWLPGLSQTNALHMSFLSREIHVRGHNPRVRNPLHGRYGGGYEVLMPSEHRKIVKVGAMQSMFWEVRIRADGNIEIDPPTLFLRRHYIGTTPILRWAWAESPLWTFNTILPWDKQQCVAVPSVEENEPYEVPEDPATWPAFGAPLEAHAVLIKHHLGYSNVGGWLHAPVDSQHVDVFFEERPDHRATSVRIPDDTVAKIRNGVRYSLAKGLF